VGKTDSLPSTMAVGNKPPRKRSWEGRGEECDPRPREGGMPVSSKARAGGPPISPHLPSPAARSPFPHQPPHPLAGPGERRCPLYEVPMSGTSHSRGIWHMNHSQSWGINYSSKRKTKQFSNCPGRKELGRGWEMGQTSGWRRGPRNRREEEKSLV